MVIKTTTSVKRPTSPKPGTPYASYVYEGIKFGFQAVGIYEDYKQYFPEQLYDKYVGKYTYKPRKRVAGYIGKKLHSKKTKQHDGSYKFNQKSNIFGSRYNRYSNRSAHCKGYEHTSQYCQF